MKFNRNKIGILIFLGVTGAVVVTVWLLYGRQDNTGQTDISNKTRLTNEKTDSVLETVEGIKYVAPLGWKTANGPFRTSEFTPNGQYLLSPDYNEAGDGNLSIIAGAYITFQKLVWEGIDETTSFEEAVNIIKNSEGVYLDPESVKLENINGVRVVMFDSGHTTDGITIFHKSLGGKWLEASFSTVSGGDGIYSAQDSPHFAAFRLWLESFLSLNR